MLLVASTNGSVGMEAGWRILSAGGSALDAVEAAAREVEDNPADHSVGYSGYPNLLGAVELDASLMDGATRSAGAVGAGQGYRHPLTIARAVMDRLPHVMVVGEGAARLAAEIGMVAEDLLTPDSASAWRDVVEGSGKETDEHYLLLSRLSSLFRDPEHVAGTVNFLAIDKAGHVASAVSTSGWAWKYPGRLGDSPVIGAGNYCDDRYGAAACTGWGELAIRGVTAYTVVSGMAAGLLPQEAGERAISELGGMKIPGAEPTFQLVAVDMAGHHAGVGTRPGSTYVAWEEGRDTFVTLPRKVVSLTD
jgi:beta-aspartyl-peptidase (threonine type)